MSTFKKVEDREITEYIDGYIMEHGYSPSYREIGKFTGLTSTSSIHRRVHSLIDKGIFETDCDAQPRTLRSPRIICVLKKV